MFNQAYKRARNLIKHVLQTFTALSFVFFTINVQATTVLSDTPLFSTNGVPANVALALSVEWPTALFRAYKSEYNNTNEYLGYWDANKCYAYKVPSTPFQGPYNTGVDNSNNVLSNGSNDPHWTATSTPSGLSSSSANIVQTGYGADSDSSYIGAVSINGTFVYETTFNIPASVNPALVEITFDLFADDVLSRIRVGDNSISYDNSNPSLTYYSPGTIRIPAGTFTTTGNQTIKLDILNTGGFGGIRIDNMSTTVGTADGNYFEPKSIAAANHVCNAGPTKYWSGNFLNWLLTQTIDPFRLALSGGYRAVDKVDLTVLEKAWATGQAGAAVDTQILNNAELIRQSTPFQTSANLKVRISGLGNKFYVTGSTSINLYSPGVNLIGDGTTINTINTKIYEMSARVKVCDPTMLEDNCTRYPSGQFKPTGLIQENAMKLNFAAFGYLLDNDTLRDGGVLRARMGPLGPERPVSGSSAVANQNAEWDAVTGVFYNNPSAADAEASGVANSGVINYLNKFGLTAKTYKSKDPVGELYYAATRYFKKQGNVSSYTSDLDDTKKDGFPVITTWDDPIKYSCQTNFIIGIGDTNTHADNNLPGSRIRTQYEPSIPPEVIADNSINVSDATNKVSQLEGLPGPYLNYGDIKKPFCCSDSGALIAGIAYDVHTKDIRSDLTGKQTIDTYFLDVLEAGDRKDVGGKGMWNQFWLAAKYGGFNNVPANYDTYAATTPPATADWDANGDGDPDNYFRANQPQLMINGLKKAFADIIVKSGGGTSVQFSLQEPEVVVGNMAFDTAYDGDRWTGDVVAGVVSFDAQNNVVVSKAWSAAEKLAAQNWDTERFIATSKCSDPSVSDGTISCKNAGIPFRNADDLSNANKTDLTVLGNSAQDVLNFLRGDTTKDGDNGFRLRRRTNGILGDIANSKLTVIGPPNLLFNDSLNPGYSAFKTRFFARQPMVYVGANDGMLHAFNATTGATGGMERFAYVPSMLFKGPSNTPNVNGLVALSKEPYLHHHYVDATPTVQDVYFNNADGVGNDEGWHTLLVGGLGKGGKGYYALDVTDPSTLNNEANLAKAVKWEFTHRDLGYSYSKPIIVKVRNTNIGSNGWVVILTSGYNNVDRNGYFFILNPETGALLYKIATYTATPSTDAGLASPNVFINNYQDFTADAVYAGDMRGNVWRLNLDNLSSSSQATHLASVDSGNGVAQPITTRVGISVDIRTGKRYVFIGTGRLLDDTDAGNTQTQSVYAITDGTRGINGYLTSATLPAGVNFPIRRANLNNNSLLFATEGIKTPAANSLGWFMDLQDNYLVNVDMIPNAGILYIAANRVVGGICDTSSAGRAFQINFASGQTASNVPFTQFPGIITNITLYRNKTDDPNGPVRARFGFQNPDGTGGSEDAPPTQTRPTPNFKQLNWRDLPIAE